MSPIPITQLITIISILAQLIQEAMDRREETVHLETLGDEHREALRLLREKLDL